MFAVKVDTTLDFCFNDGIRFRTELVCLCPNGYGGAHCGTGLYHFYYLLSRSYKEHIHFYRLIKNVLIFGRLLWSTAVSEHGYMQSRAERIFM